MKSNKIGKIYDGRWKCIEVVHTSGDYYKFILENIYNHEKIELSKCTMYRVEQGYSISRVYRRKRIIEKRTNEIKF